MNVKLSAAQKIKVLNSDDIFNVMQQILLRENKIRRQQEFFWVIGLDKHSNILFIELLALGGKNRMNVNPPEAFRVAIYKLAAQTIFVHNHPEGNITPSKEDKKTTDYLYKAGQFLKIDVIDHLIITEDKYTSFANIGLMDDIKNSGLWELVDTTKKELSNLKLEIEREKERKKTALDIAKKMKDDKVDINTIKAYTGLNLNIIKKL